LPYKAIQNYSMLYRTDIWDSVFNNYKDPICIVDRNFNILRINKNLLSLIGSTEQITIGADCKEYLYKGLSQKHIQQIESVLKTKNREIIYFVFSGNYYELTIDPVLDDNKQLFALVFIYNDVSDQVKFEEILKQKETNSILQTITANFKGIIYRCKNDPDWTMEFISEGCLEMTGYSKDALIKNKELSYNDLVLPEHRDKLWSEVQCMLKAHKLFDVEYQIKTAKGMTKWVWEQGCGVYSDKGDVIAIEGIITDITARKLMEEQMHDNEKRFSSLFNNASIPIWEEDFSEVKLYFNKLIEKGITNFRTYFTEHPDEVKHCVGLIKVIDVNDESIRFFKLLKKDQVDFNLQHYFLDESYEVLKEEIIALAEGSTMFESEIPVTNFAGMKNFILIRLVIVPGKEHDLSQVLVSFIDITEKNTAIQNLKESEERLKILIDNIPDFICFKDGEGRWHEANSAGLKFFNLDGVDYKGKKDTDLAIYSSFYTDVFRNCEETDEKAWESGKPTQTDEIIPQPIGDSLVFQITKVPTFDEDGNRKGMVVVGRDITQKKKSK
jgi:PAS domain S-box-containing protein